ncbi:MAG: mechanosensitive ion channel [Gemmatimonadales bacterium]|nr:mechanosensitive ion channel [Gemmatimonadales bacterium]NIN50129.1 mechanosensitive ion channel [Gemmatimonadales bacterium]NIP07593.1 mechanosensitive ion channel [Gemmatimonadales bacterium]NIR01745.1 mechanosensitive ion channel [Gemmatimonadales bacterium]NIS65648.1 mechanosensitive ion channel [Gemmatimonadales bacterium]
MDFLNTTFYGNSIRDWGIAALVGLVTLVALRFIIRVLVKQLAALSERTETGWDDLVSGILRKTKLVFIVVVAIFVASLVLTLPSEVGQLLTSVTVIALLAQGGIWATAAISFWLDRYRKRQAPEDRAAVTTVTAMGFVGKLVLWSVVLLLALENLGVDVTTLVAGLGVGGIAVALAVQNVLSDLFASLSIVLDKPFVIGDFLVIDSYLGTVEHIGIKTTRLRSLSGEELIFSNTDLLGSRIRNYGRMSERRVVFTVGVTYETPREKLEKIPQIIQQAVEAQDGTRFDRSHFMKFGDFSLDFETVYYVQVPDYKTYMDIQQAINLQLCARFEEDGIAFAYPTQTLYVSKEQS